MSLSQAERNELDAQFRNRPDVLLRAIVNEWDVKTALAETNARATGDLAEFILCNLRNRELTKTQIGGLFNRNLPAAYISRALNQLLVKNKIQFRVEKPESGRPITTFFVNRR